ncbi:MAG: 2'-5' RNA ligase family protein [Firmicutes bacterium]|nr:2'-5' RNA ligase family protein [Bacillota bacterium]
MELTEITMDLLKFHRKFHNYFTDFIDEQVEYYLPNAWIPHCTIALNISQAKVIKTIEEILSKYEPIEVKIKSISFVKYHPAEILSSFILQ